MEPRKKNGNSVCIVNLIFTGFSISKTNKVFPNNNNKEGSDVIKTQPQYGNKSKMTQQSSRLKQIKSKYLNENIQTLTNFSQWPRILEQSILF